jgi:hypothetical protein
MPVWEIRPGALNDHATLVPVDDRDVRDRKFVTDGTDKDWMSRPLAEFHSKKRGKKAQDPANVSAFYPGVLVLDAKARAALGGFLSRFGQLLELDCPGGCRYYFNCTNVIDCVDFVGSSKDEDGNLILEAFDESKVPSEPAVFKDLRTVKFRIYVNDAAKSLIEEWAAQAGISGLEIVQPDPI